MDIGRVSLARDAHAQRIASHIVAIGRSNVVKRAISEVKAACRTPALANHKLSGAAEAVPTLLWVDPRILMNVVRKSAYQRERFLNLTTDGMELSGVSLAHTADYEDFQADPVLSMHSLLHSTGLQASSEPTSSRQSLVKSSSDDLSTLLLNFDELNATFAHEWPCLLTHLHSKRPERVSRCELVAQAESVDVRNHNTLVVDCKQRKCSRGIRFDECLGGADVGATARLCDLAARQAGGRTANVCVRAVVHRNRF